MLSIHTKHKNNALYPWLAAVASGVLLNAAYPVFSIRLLAWCAFVPYIFSVWLPAERTSYRLFMLQTFLFVLVWHAIGVWWISYVTFAGMLTLILLISFLYALVLGAARYVMQHGMPGWLALVIGWLACETILTYFLTGFPWLLLGYACRPDSMTAQIADITGVYGVSVLILSVNYAFVHIIHILIQKRVSKNDIALVIGAIALISIFLFYGVWRTHAMKNDHAEMYINVGCVQANIPPVIKHDRQRDIPTLQKYVRLTDIVMTQSPDIVCWPETAVPGYYQSRQMAYITIKSLLERIKTPLITGMARYLYLGENNRKFYNSVAIIEETGLISASYDKMHLVMFGEYVPYERFLPFLSLVTPISGSYSPGNEARTLPFEKKGQTLFFGPLICFEDVFSYLSRRMSRAGADVLLNVTNDGWFHSSPGPYQHATLAAWRAIEVRRPLLRVTNTGVTQLIDRMGRVRDEIILKGKRTEVEGTMVCAVPVYANKSQTIYALWGDWLPIGGSCVLGLSFSLIIIKRLRRRGTNVM